MAELKEFREAHLKDMSAVQEKMELIGSRIDELGTKKKLT
jgi:hypothetical protein